MKYKITITETFVCDVEVEANSIEEAIEKGGYYYFDGVLPFYAWFVSKLKCVGYVSAKECYDEYSNA